jgi:guanine nucleotide-binding protein G(i) subunit alpha
MKLIHEGTQRNSALVGRIYSATVLFTDSNTAGAYTVDERESYKEIIFSNTIQSMHVILDAMESMGIELGDASNQQRADIILSLPHQIEGDFLEPEVAEAVDSLWIDSGVRACFERSREYQLNDSAQ